MQALSPDAGARDQRVVELMRDVHRMVAERRDADALRILEEAATLWPDHPLVLMERARRVALAGNATAARAMLERAVAVAPENVTCWLNLAGVLRTLGDRKAELEAIERALTLAPTHLVALLQKGALLDLMGRPRAAAAAYVHALQTLAAGTRLPPPIEAHVAHARRRVADNAEIVAGLLQSRLADLRAAGTAGERRRFERCMDRMLGRARIYTPEPTHMLFPFLAHYEFFAREDFSWLEQLEAATDSIRAELLGVLEADQAGVEPYIAYREGLPLNQWRELNHSRRWSAYFLWKDGQPQQEHMARCPLTVAALRATPQVDIAGRGPTAFFSMLEPRTHIPAHTGSTNTRLTVHLPLIVPEGCRFRVGSETREWRTGVAWVFDDTIEHEAWNDADLPRAILIFDIWNSQLTALERDLVREATEVLAEYNDPDQVT